MLATFVIMLREGLEAALIVGIVAAFLKRNGQRLAAMWAGVAAALAISLAVGVGLKLAESSLPQRQQEGMETVIGAVAVGFVTSMIVWMGAHARELKSQLESAAAGALSQGTSRALAVMAFLAVLKEGFEASVFLLATFQAAGSAASAAAGAVLGLLGSVLLGVAIYRGGIRLDMGRFFRFTSVFLVLVAAGLVVSCLRTAHEAGWLNTGQQATVDMRWLAPAGSVRGALFTGVLGIPADPRLVEVLGWLAYLIPMLALVLWPAHRRLTGRQVPRFKVGLGVAAVVAATLLAVLGPRPSLDLPDTAAANDAGGDPVGTVSLHGAELTTPSGSTVTLTNPTATQHDGVDATQYTASRGAGTTGLPTRLTLDRLTKLAGGRVPVGVNAATSPGPYRASWTAAGAVTAWTVDGHLLDASDTSRLVVNISGGGLPYAHTVAVTDASGLGSARPSSWAVDGAHSDAVATLVRRTEQERVDARLWTHLIPTALGLAAAGLFLSAWRDRRRDRAVAEPQARSQAVSAGATPVGAGSTP